MRIGWRLAVAALIVASGCTDGGGRVAGPAGADGSAMPPASGGAAGDTIPGRWIVVLTSQANPVALQQQVLQAFGGRVHHTYVAAVRGFAADLPPQAVAALRSNPNVQYVEPDRLGGVLATQTNATWGLDRVDQRARPLSTTYTYNNTGAGVNVYVLDTGVRRTHNDFGGRAGYIANGRNGDFMFDTYGNTSGAEDCHGHGTHVAGTIGGTTWGVAKGVRIYAGRVVDCTGHGPASAAIAGVDWVRQHAVRPAVTNMSLQYGNVQALRDAVNNAVAAGISFAVAAGNGDSSGTPINACNNSPSNAVDAVTVGATNSSDVEASFSNYGPCVDLLAPGVSVTSAWYSSNTATRSMNGTSMATPHVAGALALYLEANPAATPAGAAAALRTNATANALSLHSASRTGGTPNLLLYTAFIGGGQQPPLSDFEFSCADRACAFNSTSTDDGPMKSWAWDFGDGRTGSGPSPDHTYGSTGTFSVRLTVTDAQGLTHSRTRSVAVSASANRPPTANFRVVVSGLTASFTDLSGDAGGSIAARLWRFGDGATATTANASRTYAAAGTYLVTFEVTDNAGARHWQSVPVTVGGPANAVPFASMTFPCTANTCTFTDRSDDADGTIVSRLWFLADGTTSTAATFAHAYGAPGVYNVTLQVVDDDGAMHRRTRQVVVTAPASNQPPTAGFTHTCTHLGCSFTDASTDGDGTIAAWSWTFGDGATSTQKNPTHSFASAGSYTVTLKVTDNLGATATVAKSISVTAPPPSNQQPVASFTVSCSVRTCSFGDASTDADGSIVAHAWNFGDGTSASAPSAFHTYAAGGARTVSLTVTDDQGATHTKSLSVNVPASGSYLPVPNWRVSCSGLSCTFRDISADVDGSMVARSWGFGDGGTATAATASHTFAAAGTHMVTLRVTDSAGADAWLTMPVVVGSANQTPFASFTFPCTGTTCTFTDHSNDADGAIVSWHWDFGDGATATTQHATRAYAAAGTYYVTLTVIDNAGAVHRRVRAVTTN